MNAHGYELLSSAVPYDLTWLALMVPLVGLPLMTFNPTMSARPLALALALATLLAIKSSTFGQRKATYCAHAASRYW
jgi:hypothetical protein